MTTRMTVFIYSTPSTPIVQPPVFQVSTSTSSSSSVAAATTEECLSPVSATSTAKQALSFLPSTNFLPDSPSSSSSSLLEIPSVTPTNILQQQQIKDQDVDDDNVNNSIPFKLWRSQHMMNTRFDDHDNIPIDSPLPSTLQEKYLRRSQRAVQLQQYRKWNIKEFRQRRRQLQQQQLDDIDSTVCHRVRFSLPPKLKRNHSSSSSSSSSTTFMVD